MAQIIESIPNISEGRRPEVIEACVDQIRTTPGCTLLNYSSDESHNRTVITYIGDAKGVEEASVKSDEFEIIPVYGDPLLMADTIGALSANSLYWTSNKIDYYITSEKLSGEELLTIAEGMGNSSLIVNAEK